MINANKFSLSVVSQLADFKGKTLMPYYLDGIDTIGVWREPFELKFKNNSHDRVQVRLSIDGTDILTAKPAHTDTTNDGMWVVEAYQTLSLKAWPETTERGRAFVFGDEGASVAAHTHGDLSNKGIIAAAVFTESAPKPVYSTYFGSQSPYYTDCRVDLNKGGKIRRRHSGESDADSRLESTGPAVGAGQELSQKITSAKGLVQPRLDRIIRLKYTWRNELETKLASQGYVKGGHPSGFPGNKEKQLANLGTTPSQGGSVLIPIRRFGIE